MADQEEDLYSFKRDCKRLRIVKNAVYLIAMAVIALAAYQFVDFTQYGIRDAKSGAIIVVVLQLIAFSIASAIYQKVARLRTQSWPFAACTVLSKEVHRFDVYGGDKYGPFKPVLFFSYEVNGESFMAEYVWPEKFSSEVDAWKATNAYQIGGSYFCLYNPDHPERAVLRLLNESNLNVSYADGAS